MTIELSVVIFVQCIFFRTKIIELSKLSDEVDLEDYKKIYSEVVC